MLRCFVEKLQKSLSALFVLRRLALDGLNQEKVKGGSLVPEDVMEGHFAVLAIKGEETKRFIVKLEYLSDPMFMELLDQAREEYGFKQKGALAVPCWPQQLKNILDSPRPNSTNAPGSIVDGSNMSHIVSMWRESNVSKPSAEPLSIIIIIRGIVSFINIRLHIKNILRLR